MRGAVASVGLLAMVLVASSCASSKSPGIAAASGPVVAASSPVGGSASSVGVSSSAVGSESPIPMSSRAPRCSSVAGGTGGPSSSGPDGQLFVAGSPTLATLCQSVPFNADGGSPPAPVLVQIVGPVLAKLIASLNRLAPTNDVLPCPAPADVDVITFSGSTLASSTVWITVDSGCNFVWSDTGVHAYASKGLLQQLGAILAGSPASASTPLVFGQASPPASPMQAAVPPVGSHVAATPEPGVTITCPDIVHGDPGAIGLGADPSAQPLSRVHRVSCGRPMRTGDPHLLRARHVASRTRRSCLRQPQSTDHATSRRVPAPGRCVRHGIGIRLPLVRTY